MVLDERQPQPRTIGVPRGATILCILVLVCAASASTITLAWQGSFPQASTAPGINAVLAEARGWSAATLFLAIPLSVASLVAANRGSMRGHLAWIGSLAYFVYTYLEFAVSPPFSALYLLYVTAFACAIPALVLGLASTDVAALPELFGDRAPRRGVGIFSLLFSAVLSVAWLKEIAARMAAGAFGWPVGADAVGHVVRALDLGLQVPLGLATGFLLLRRRAVGDLLAAITLVNVVCMGAALTAMVAWTAAASGEKVWTAGWFALVWSVGVVLAMSFFRGRRGSAPLPVG